ncbi:MAG: hypothetical protein CTY13_02525 [Methylobacter sp.]|nr:MAG: hypothetical protein CTY13_02525 [Methylobacter sp.]
MPLQFRVVPINGLKLSIGFFHSSFDRLRANGKIFNLMAMMLCVGTIKSKKHSAATNKPALKSRLMIMVM